MVIFILLGLKGKVAAHLPIRLFSIMCFRPVAGHVMVQRIAIELPWVVKTLEGLGTGLSQGMGHLDIPLLDIEDGETAEFDT